MPVVNICDKGVLKFTPEQLEKGVQRLNDPDVRQKLAQRHEESREFIRQVRIYDRNNTARLAHVRIGENEHVR